MNNITTYIIEKLKIDKDVNLSIKNIDYRMSSIIDYVDKFSNINDEYDTKYRKIGRRGSLYDGKRNFTITINSKNLYHFVDRLLTYLEKIEEKLDFVYTYQTFRINKNTIEFRFIYYATN